MISPEVEEKIYLTKEKPNLPTRDELIAKKEAQLLEAMQKLDTKPAPALANIGVTEEDIKKLHAASYEFAKSLIPMLVDGELELLQNEQNKEQGKNESNNNQTT